ncbi:hypothetical protein HK097_008622, partial [Rhizophlyctis rosea]
MTSTQFVAAPSIARLLRASTSCRDEFVSYLKSGAGGRKKVAEDQKIGRELLVTAVLAGEPQAGKTEIRNNLRAFLRDQPYVASQTQDADTSHRTLNTFHYLFPFTRNDLTAYDRTAPRLCYGITDCRGWEAAPIPDIATTIANSSFDTSKYDSDLQNEYPSTFPHDVVLLVLRPPEINTTTQVDTEDLYSEFLSKYAEVLVAIGVLHRVLFLVTHADKLTSAELQAFNTAMIQCLRIKADQILNLTNITSADSEMTADWEENMWKLVTKLVKQKEAGLKGMKA